MRSAMAGSHGDQRLSAQQLINLDGMGGQEMSNMHGIAPMKLNFADEAIGAESGFPASIQDYPSLKDLETSNWMTSSFRGGKAEQYALRAIE